MSWFQGMKGKKIRLMAGALSLVLLLTGVVCGVSQRDGKAAKTSKKVSQDQAASELQGDLPVVSGAKNGKKVAIDAGHQLHANSALEPIGPGAKTKKAKVAGGCTGAATRVPEYKFTLRLAKKLEKELKSRGYEVYMIRTKNNVNISNKQRARRANKSGADIYIRLHGDSSASSSVTGASGLYPSKRNKYVGKLSAKSLKLTKAILKSYCKKTGIRNRGAVVRDDLTGTNWSKIPVTLIECGFMSNKAEDRKLQNASFQKKMANGIADGIDGYFGF